MRANPFTRHKGIFHSNFLPDLLFRFRFRYDLFISYSRKDGRDYAINLRQQLKELDYQCFLDTEEIPAGSPLKATLVQALQTSAVLLVLATEESQKSPYVELEISEFESVAPLRRIIPIRFRETLVEWPWKALQSREVVWIDDTVDALKRGFPSPAVAASIDHAFQYTRRNLRVRVQKMMVALLFVLGALLSAWLLSRRTEELLRQQDRADLATATARESIQQANRARDEMKRAREETERQKTETNRQVEVAARAFKQELIAKARAGRARREQEIAEKKTREAQANILATLSEQERDGSLEGEHRSALLAIESLRKEWTPAGWNALSTRIKTLADKSKPPFAWPSPVGSLQAAAYHPQDSNLLALAGAQGLAVVSRFRARSMRRFFESRSVSSLAFSNDGRWLAAGIDCTVHVIDMAVLKEVAEISPEESSCTSVSALTFNPAGNRLAFIAQDGKVALFAQESLQGRDWKAILTPPRLGDSDRHKVLSLSFSPDGRWLALGATGSLGIWDVEKGMLAAQASPVGTIQGIAFGRDGNYLTAVSRDAIQNWRIRTLANGNTELSEGSRARQSGSISAVAFSVHTDSAPLLAVGGRDGTITVWDPRLHEKRQIILGGLHESPVAFLAFRPDGELLATNGHSAFSSIDLLTTWPTTGSRVLAQRKMDVSLSALTFSHSGRWLAAGGTDRSLRLFGLPKPEGTDLDLGRLYEIPHPGFGQEVDSLAFSPNDRWLAVTTPRGVKILDTSKGWILAWEGPGNPGTFPALHFSPGSRWLLEISDRLVRLVALGAWKQPPPIALSANLESFSFSTDDTWLRLTTRGEVDNGKLVRPGVTEIYHMPTGRRVAWQSDEDQWEWGKSVQFQGLQEGKRGGRLDLIQRSSSWELVYWKVFGGAYRSPDHRWWIMVDSGQVTLWTSDGSNEYLDHGKGRRILAAAVTPDSRWLVTSGDDKTLRLWALTGQTLIDQICKRIPVSAEFKSSSYVISLAPYTGCSAGARTMSSSANDLESQER